MARRVKTGAATPVVIEREVANQVTPITFDNISGSISTNPIQHVRVHTGVTFQASYKSPEGGDIGDNSVLNIFIQTGVNFNHFVFSTTSGGTSELFIFEDTVVSADGTPLAVWNMNRPKSIVSTSQVSHTPTITSDGTRIHNSLMPGGTGNNRLPGGTARPGTEWILSPNTNYLIRIVNRAGSSQPIGFVGQWYEVTDNN